MSEVRRHKTFDQDFNTIMDYIRLSGGTVVTIGTVVEKTGLNTVYANNILKVIKESPMIECMKDESNKKSTYFKFKEDVPAVIEIKMHKKYKNLTEAQVEYVQSTLSKNKTIGSSSDMLMAIVNALAGLGGTNQFVDKYAEKIGDLLILRNTQVRLYADMLQQSELILLDVNKARLLLGDTATDPVVEAAEELVATKEAPAPIVEKVEEPVTTDPEIKPERKPIAWVEDKIKEPVQEPVVDITVYPSETESALIANMESFKGFIGQFQNFMGEMISQVDQGSSKAEVEELKATLDKRDKECDLYKKQLEEGNMSLTRFLTENSNLKEALDKKIKENIANKKLIAVYKEANDNVFAAMQEKFQILLADINNTISDYTRIPAWQITPSHTARVQTQVINAITTAMNELLNSNCATIVE